MTTKKELKRQRALEAAKLLGLGEDNGEAEKRPAEAQLPVHDGTRPGAGKNSAPARGQAGSGGSKKRPPAPDKSGNGKDRAPEPVRIPDQSKVEPPRNIRGARGDVATGPSLDVPYFIPPEKRPKNHAPGSLAFRTPVFYRNERYYIEWSPADWTQTTFVRITSKHIPEGDDAQWDALMHVVQVFRRGEAKFGLERESFCVHADELTLAPVMTARAELLGRTVSVNQAAAKARGDKDIGDPVALMLRDCKSIEDVYAAGAKFLKVKAEELKAKYAHLNPGQQRMNVGNKMRAAWRKQQK